MDGDLRTKGGKSREANSDRPIFVVCLRAERHVEPYRALRRGLKMLLRACRLRCVIDNPSKRKRASRAHPTTHRVGLFGWACMVNIRVRNEGRRLWSPAGRLR